MLRTLLTGTMLGGALLLSLAPAHANPLLPTFDDTVTVTGDSYLYDTANISFAGLPGGSTTLDDVSSDPDTLSGTFVHNGVTTGFSGLLAYCTDLYNYFSDGTYTVGHLTSSHQPDTTSPLSTTQVNDIAELIAAPDHADQAATQLAIWKVEYGDAFTFTTNAATTDNVAAYLAGLSGSFPAHYQMYQLQAAGNQGLVYGDPVPEPATLAVLGIGLLGLTLVRRRPGVRV